MSCTVENVRRTVSVRLRSRLYGRRGRFYGGDGGSYGFCFFKLFFLARQQAASRGTCQTLRGLRSTGCVLRSKREGVRCRLRLYGRRGRMYGGHGRFYGGVFRAGFSLRRLAWHHWRDRSQCFRTEADPLAQVCKIAANCLPGTASGCGRVARRPSQGERSSGGIKPWIAAGCPSWSKRGSHGVHGGQGSHHRRQVRRTLQGGSCSFSSSPCCRGWQQRRIRATSLMFHMIPALAAAPSSAFSSRSATSSRLSSEPNP